MGVTLLEKATEGNKRAFKKLMQRDSEFIYKLAFLHTKYEDDTKNYIDMFDEDGFDNMEVDIQ